MSTTQRHGLPFVWVTWITGLLSGDKQCVWASWYRAHFRYAKRPDPNFDTAVWTSDHMRLVNARLAQLKQDGWTVTVEGENDLKLSGHTALLSGKPDLIAMRGNDVLVSDAKTGKQRPSDWWQVLIYQLLIPRVRPKLARSGGIHGEVVYGAHRVSVAPEELTPERSDQIFALLRTIGSAERPARTPTRFECGFCDIADCPDRIVAIKDEQLAMAQEF